MVNGIQRYARPARKIAVIAGGKLVDGAPQIVFEMPAGRAFRQTGRKSQKFSYSTCNIQTGILVSRLPCRRWPAKPSTATVAMPGHRFGGKEWRFSVAFRTAHL
jgi:hypothetical protein